jgi:cytochrome c peroxidase
MTERAEVQAELVSAAALENPDFHGGHGWSDTVEHYHKIRTSHEIGDEDVALPAIRAAMMRQTERYKDQFIWGQFDNTTLYRLPERFGTVL